MICLLVLNVSFDDTIDTDEFAKLQAIAEKIANCKILFFYYFRNSNIVFANPFKVLGIVDVKYVATSLIDEDEE